ncbi:GNAT family N-acetyltransferase [Candidatus Woesearchaeota archaeon]|nr:GNAT family N-acetyltransferase [Candidatus Woesearchaeota archaeon]
MTRLNGKMINLRHVKESDASSIKKHAGHRHVTRYTSNIPHPYTLGHAQRFIRTAKRQHLKKEAAHFGIESKADGEIIGMISLKLDRKHKKAEVGYWLGREHWGKGFAKEALRMILDFGFKRLRLRRIYAYVMHPNRRSYGLLEKTGFKKEGRMKKDVIKEGREYDRLVYAILR